MNNAFYKEGVRCFLRVLAFFLVTYNFNVVAANKLPSIKTPSFMSLTEVEGGTKVGSMQVRTFYFTSTKNNEKIEEFYNKLWDDRLKTVRIKQWTYHSYYDGQYLYSIQVETNTKGLSDKYMSAVNGVIGISEPAATQLRRKTIKKESFYPFLPGTKVLTDISAVDLGSKSRTIVLDSPGNVINNLSHYKFHFERKGWGEVLNKMSLGMATEQGATSLIMQKGVDELVVSFIPSKGRTKIVGVLVEK